MPNPFFSFKQFTVYHDRCAMKVGTDGVLLGAWARVENAQSVLDIGSGSGLISLMIAQRNSDSTVYAIDIDSAAIEQTEYNVIHSPYADRIRYKNASLGVFVQETDMKFDHIVSNPPFFADSLKSPDKQRTTARHTDTLSAEDLIADAVKVMSDGGRISLIYPAEYKEELFVIAKKYGLFVTRLTSVYPTLNSAVKRILIELSNKERELEEISLLIEKERHLYSDDFVSLIKDFYLKY